MQLEEAHAVQSPSLDRKVAVLFVKEDLTASRQLAGGGIIGSTEEEIRQFKPRRTADETAGARQLKSVPSSQQKLAPGGKVAEREASHSD